MPEKLPSGKPSNWKTSCASVEKSTPRGCRAGTPSKEDLLLRKDGSGKAALY